MSFSAFPEELESRYDDLHYSGPNSEPFWMRVNKLPQPEQDILYRMGCVLQTLEHHILDVLKEAEEDAEKNSNL